MKTKIATLLAFLFCLSLTAQGYIQIGSGAQVSDPFGQDDGSPYTHGYGCSGGRFQIIYNAAEINAAGFTGPGFLNAIGFYASTLPEFGLEEYTVGVKTTSDTDASNHEQSGYTTVYYNASYLPNLADDFNMITFDQPFFWDGTSSIRIEICFKGIYNGFSESPGATRIFNSPLGMRYFYDDCSPSIDICNFNTAYEADYKPQIRMEMFPVSAIDASLAGFASPVMPFDPGSRSVQVLLRSFGDNALTSATINWTVDGVAGTPYQWSGSLNRGDAPVAVPVGAAIFSQGQAHVLRAWTSNPNGTTDGYAPNDTTTAVVYTSLAGTYTIGGTNPDFPTIAEAVSLLRTAGVGGQVIFNMRSGTFNEQISIGAIPGADCANTVTFQSETGNPADVIWTQNSAGGGSNYTLGLNGAQGLRFKNITFRAESQVCTCFGVVIEVTGGSHCNTFEGNVLEGRPATFAGLDLAVVRSFNEGRDTANAFLNNQVTQGAYGIFWSANSPDFESDLLIQDNTFTGQYSGAVYVEGQIGGSIEGNAITTGTTASYQGIFGRRLFEDFSIAGNQLDLPGNYDGIYLDECAGDSLTRQFRIANNFVYVGGVSGSRGIYVSESSKLDFIFNNVHVNSTSTAASAFSISSFQGANTSLRLFNNNLVNTGPGLAFLSTEDMAVDSANHNNYYVEGATLASAYGAALSDLAALQAASGMDPNSISISPEYVSDSDLHVGSSFLNGAGIPIAGLTTDIDGEMRDTLQPDIGADEFTPPATDATVIALANPEPLIPEGIHEIVIEFVNAGSDTLKNVEVEWEVNGVAQSSSSWSGVLLTNDTTSLSLGLFPFDDLKDFDLRIWTSMPNGLVDEKPQNDTLLATVGVGLSGIYTIGGTNPDFANFTEATGLLTARGAAGPVTFNVRPGIYNEQASLSEVAGMSAVNTVTFQSEQMDSTSATLSFSGTYTFAIDGTDHLFFRHLTLEAVNTFTGHAFQAEGEVENIQFTNCLLKGPASPNTQFGREILSFETSTSYHDVLIRNNHFLNGSVGFYMDIFNPGSSGNITVEGNTFLNQAHNAIEVEYIDSFQVLNNIISTNRNSSGFAAMDILGATGAMVIAHNEIALDVFGGTGIFIENSIFQPGLRGRIFNNFIQIGGANTLNYNTRGLYIDDSDYLDVSYNNINVNKSSSNLTYSRGLDNFRSDYNNYFNNVIVNSGTGYAFYWFGSTGVLSDYNDLYTNGTTLGYYNGNRIDLAAWQSASGFDANSVSVDPGFASVSDLHVSQTNLDGAGLPLAGITTDIDGQTRNETTPDIGADEFGTGLVSQDIGVLALILPESACELSDQEPVSVRIQNYGVDPATGFDVALYFDSTNLITENVGGLSIPGGASAVYTFSATLDLSLTAIYNLDIYTQLAGDEEVANDSLLGVAVQHYPEVIAATVNDTTICYGQKPLLRAFGGSAYVWTSSESNLEHNSSSGYYVPFYPPEDSLTYYVTVRNDFGCEDADSVIVNVIPPPPTPLITASPIDPDVCGAADSVLLTSDITENIVWSTGANTASIILPTPVSGISVTHTDVMTGCTATGQTSVLTGPPPSLTCSSPGPACSLCAGQSATLRASATGATAFQWSTNETTTSISVSPVVNTTYSVTVTTQPGCDYVLSRTVTVATDPGPPLLTGVTADTTICAGQPVTLMAAGTADFYTWRAGGTTISNNANRTVMPTETTTYTVSLANQCNASVIMDTVTITVLPSPANAPIIVATGSTTLSFCDTDTITLNATSALDSVLWSTGDTTDMIQVTDPGTYTLFHFNEFGCPASDAIVLLDPAPGKIDGPEVICDDETVSLTVLNGLSQMWSTGETTQTISVTPGADTTFSVFITNDLGCMYYDTLDMTVLRAPMIDTVVATVGCIGGPIELTVYGNGTEYIWSDGQKGTTITVYPPDTTTYTVTSSLEYGCAGSFDQGFVLVEPLPVPVKPVILQGDTAVICAGDSIDLHTDLNTDLIWSTGDTVTTVRVTTPGAYVASYTLDNICFSRDTIAVLNPVEPAIFVDPFTTLCFGDMATLTVTGLSSVLWSTGESSFGIDVTPDTTTTYSFQGQNSYNCSFADSVTIEVIPAIQPGAVENMFPLDNELEVEQPVQFSWAPPTNSSHFDLYLWEADSAQATVPVKSDFPEFNFLYIGGAGNLFQDGPLEFGRTYEWQVVAKNSCSETLSPIQSFTLRELPDLVVTDVVAPDTVFSGQTVTIEWTVQNQGLGSTRDVTWLDYEVLSADTAFDGWTGLIRQILGSATNLASLEPGQSYTHQRTFRLDVELTGDYHVLTLANVPPNQKLIEDDDDHPFFKRWGRDSYGSDPIHIELGTVPDLQVTSIIPVPANTAFSGQNMTVQYTVRNMGHAPAPNSTFGGGWRDRIWLSDDDEFLTGGVLLDNAVHVDSLFPGESYTGQFTFRLPDGISGKYFLHVETNWDLDVFEHAFAANNRTVSDTLEIILAPPPNLVVSRIDIADTLNAGQDLPFRWTIQNTGTSVPGVVTWSDLIRSGTSSDYTESLPAAPPYYHYNKPLLPGDTLANQLIFTVPEDWEGERYFFVKVDYAEEVFEDNFEDDNVTAVGPITILNPDLVVSNIALPDTVPSGEPLNLQWTVVNNGPGAVLDRVWTDSVFLSPNSVLVPEQALPLGAIEEEHNLPADGNLVRQLGITIPNGLEGDYFIHVVTDVLTPANNNNGKIPLDAVHEATNEDNNTGVSSAFYIDLSDSPDLVPVGLTVPGSAMTGMPIDVYYEVANQGQDSLVSPWLDTLVLSSQPDFPPIDTLAQIFRYHNLVLQPDSASGQSFRMIVPPLPFGDQAGTYYLHVQADSPDDIYEHLAEDNNEAVSAGIPIQASNLDLAVITADSLPAASGSGRTGLITYRVENVGDRVDLDVYRDWKDRLYLSADNTWGADDLLMGETEILAQAVGTDTSYLATLEYMVPHGVSGQYYFLLVANANQTNHESNRNNNVLAHGPITVELSPSPDLVVTELSLPNQIIAGLPFTLSWTVQNQGNDTIYPPEPYRGWRDLAFLSRDQELDYFGRVDWWQGDGRIFADNWYREALPPDSSYTITKTQVFGDSFFRDFTFTGNYLFVLQTDVLDNIFEFGGEDNNFTSRLVQVILPEPTDLAVTNVTVPKFVSPGDSIDIGWTVTNQGNEPAIGMITDALYLSEDTVWDVSDILLHREEHTIFLAQEAAFTRQAVARVPGVAVGEYHVLVRTDIFNSIREEELGNNIGYHAMPLENNVLELPLEVLTPAELEDDESLYYRIEIPDSLEGATMVVLLTSPFTGANNELYLSYDEPPSRAEHDFTFRFPAANNQELAVPFLRSGTYYLQVYGQTPDGSTQANIELFADIVDFEVRRVNANQGGNTGQVTVRVEGARFESGMTAKLVRVSDDSAIVATRVIYQDATEVFASFDLTGASLGFYHFRLVKTNGDSTQLNDAFEVVEGTTPVLSYILQMPPRTGPFGVVPMSVYYVNESNVDITDLTGTIHSLNQAPIGWSVEDFQYEFRSLPLLFAEAGGPTDVLRPGASGTLIVLALANPIGGSFKYFEVARQE